jgi:hypothetical protein
MWNKIKRWLWRKGIIKCKHEWVPAREFYAEWEGKDHENLKPKPMKYRSGYQTNAYVCRKCYDYYLTIEKVEDGDNSL